MGKSRDSRHHKAKGNKKTRDVEEGSEEEEEEVQHRQSANMGLLPPSDSEDEEEPEKPAAPKQTSKVGELPPNSDSEGDSESESEEEDNTPEYFKEQPKKKAAPVEERSEELIRKDLERLELVRQRREADRLKRIADEGWDRFAPVTETNKPPGTNPVEKKD